MPTPEELVKLTPREVYGRAVRAGIEVAVKHQSIGLKTKDGRDALTAFYEDHPEFKDERVEPMMHAGAAEDLLDILRKVSEIPNAIGVLNETGHGAEMLHVEPRSDRKRVQKETKRRFGLFKKG